MMATMILTWRYPVLAAEPSSMHIANVYRGGAMRRGTPSVKYAARLQNFNPDYTAPAPLFGRFTMNTRGNWDISMGGVDYPHFAALVSADHNFLAYESDEYAAFYPRSLIFCRVVAITFVLLLMLRTMLPIIVGVAGDNSVILVMLLVLKAIGILLAVYVVVKTFIAVRHRRHQQVRKASKTLVYFFKLNHLIMLNLHRQSNAVYLMKFALTDTINAKLILSC
ncbi:hypothetical protein T459_06438 [Capsicum annuum]|uniref:Uncharacterized protein n=1 Tax=Capsicum annuum TaxID=4072 RepID=A0A2G3AAT5_CAPAN|nr:putative serine/threonine-protein kinase CTR1-like [Capsicum annuum]PHT91325.1 hypothetical protein T459_06438 [Capsicum annuum]